MAPKHGSAPYPAFLPLLTILHLLRKKKSKALKSTSSNFDLQPPKKNKRGNGEKWEQIMEFNCRKDFESSEVGVEIKKHFYSLHNSIKENWRYDFGIKVY